MPNHVGGAKRVLEFVAEGISTEAYVNVMARYRPHYLAKSEEFYSDIGRRVTLEEYDEVLSYARELGLSRLDVDRGMA